MKSSLRMLPAIHELQRLEQVQPLKDTYSLDQEAFTAVMQSVLADIRSDILNENWNGSMPGTSEFLDELVNRIEDQLHKEYSFSLKKVINATGTVLHTNLGRARLSKEAIRNVTEIAGQYSNLEYVIEKGERGSRHSILEKWIKKLTGAEAAMVVNNNAAAVYLILRALSKEKEVIVSRGQLVEIGGSFRISSIMEESGAVLNEIGTTNKTHLQDYVQAINEHTAMIMKVHTSNFKIIGFTKSVETEPLIDLAHKEGLIFYEDLGSGLLFDFASNQIGDEPHVKEIIAQGADLVSFSGDKLLGGPQAGIIAGKREYIDALKRHQLARVLRVDKMTFAALEATLAAYSQGEESAKSIPTVRDILLTEEEIKTKANKLIHLCQGHQLKIELLSSTSMIGGGTMPGIELPTYVVSVSVPHMTSNQLHGKLRKGTPSLIGRVQDDRYLLDMRTVADDEISETAEALIKCEI